MRDTTSLNPADSEMIALAIRSQYDTILRSQNTRESLILRLSDNNATLVITVQNEKITMTQLTLRNLYPNSPDMAPTPYTDILGDGILETFPADTKTLPQSSLTYGNYLALLTRFGMPTEIRQEDIPAQNTTPKDRRIDIARDIMPPSPEIFSRIAQ